MARDESRIAVLIDSDNVSAKHIANVLTELTRYGTTSVRRMYGDWTTTRLGAWKEAANEHSIQPIQQFAYTTRKNSTDSALIIDAMDLLHQGHLDTFAIVSSDSDFTRLAGRIRESGVRVLGFGARNTPPPFRNACDAFTYLETLEVGATEPVPSSSEPSTGTTRVVTPAPARATTNDLRGDTKLMNLLRLAIAAESDDDGWAQLGRVGWNIRRQSPDFDSRNWGYAKLGELVMAVGLFEVKRIEVANGGSTLRVRTPPKK